MYRHSIWETLRESWFYTSFFSKEASIRDFDIFMTSRIDISTPRRRPWRNEDSRSFRLFAAKEMSNQEMSTTLGIQIFGLSKLWYIVISCCFFLRGSVTPFPIVFCYRQVAILLWLLGITIIISPPYHKNAEAYPLNCLPNSTLPTYLNLYPN
jgi:hypothetical protein